MAAAVVLQEADSSPDEAGFGMTGFKFFIHANDDGRNATLIT
jgi:hypothetical protein